MSARDVAGWAAGHAGCTAIVHGDARDAALPDRLGELADLGDCPVNPADVMDGLKRVETYFKKLVAKGIRPLSAGGDHLCSLPVLRAVGEKQPVGMIHFDAHTDLYDGYFGGFKYTHGTPFRRAMEEGLIDPNRYVLIGIRGSAYGREDWDFAADHGIRIIGIDEFHRRGVEDVMTEARSIVGDGETYVTYDIDFVDPTFAPGTGTPSRCAICNSRNCGCGAMNGELGRV